MAIDVVAGAPLMVIATVLGAAAAAMVPARVRPLVQNRAPPIDWLTHVDARGTPVADASHVFVRTQRHELVAADVTTGAIRWRARLGTPPGLVTGGRIVLAGALVLTGDDGLEAFDRVDGTFRWRTAVDAGAGIGIYLGAAAAGRVFAGSYTGDLRSIDIVTGHVVWSRHLARDDRTIVFAPVMDDDQVVASVASFSAPASGGVAAVDHVGRVRWQTWLPGEPDDEAPGGVIGTCATAPGLVLVTRRDGTIFALDRSTGHMEWTWPASTRALRSDRPIEDFRPLVVSDGILVAGSLSGKLTAYDLSTRRERWTVWPLESSVAFGLAVSDAVVYVPFLSGQVVAIDLGDGHERWRIGGHAEGFRWVPGLAGPHIFVSGAGAGLVAMRRDRGE